MTQDQISLLVGGTIIVVLLVLIGFVSRSVRRNAIGFGAHEEVARIEERSDFTFGGVIAVLMMVLHNAAMALAFFLGTKSAVQEASIGTIWIAGNVLWGACMIIGRRSTYRVLRTPDPPAEPRV